MNASHETDIDEGLALEMDGIDPTLSFSPMTTIDRLNEICLRARQIDGVARADVWIPDADDCAELRADGIDPQPQLEVIVWRSNRDATNVRCEVEGLGVECVGSGSADLGPCYSFRLRAVS